MAVGTPDLFLFLEEERGFGDNVVGIGDDRQDDEKDEAFRGSRSRATPKTKSERESTEKMLVERG